MSSAMRLILLRHAETEWNMTGRLTSRTDLDLSPEGITQAERVCKSLTELGPVPVIRSPAARAAQTIVSYITEMGIDDSIDDRFHEVDFGIYEGCVGHECRQEADFRRWEAGENSTKYVAEPLHEAVHRIKSAIGDIIKRKPSDAIVVTHGVLLRLFVVSEVFQLPPGMFRRLRIDNARGAIVVFDEGKWRLTGFNVPAVGLAEWGSE